MLDKQIKSICVLGLLLLCSQLVNAQTMADDSLAKLMPVEETWTPEPNGTEPFMESIGNDPAGPTEPSGDFILIPIGESVIIEEGGDAPGPVETVGGDLTPAATKPKE